MTDEHKNPEDEKNMKFFDSIMADDQQMPELIEVEVKQGDTSKLVQVRVEKFRGPKTWLGGFRQTSTNIFQQDATAQTDQIKRQHAEMIEREIQTQEYKTRSTGMTREFGTQMGKNGVQIDERVDKVVHAQRQFTGDQWEEKRLKTALFIQCCVRGWFARKRANSIRSARDEKENMLRDKEEAFLKDEEEKHRTEIERRMQPKTQKDFEILYNELEAWRNAETKKIKDNPRLELEEKQKSLQILLLKEVKLLQTIDRLKNKATKKNREEKITKFLDNISAPKLWSRDDGRLTEVDTPFTTRARELFDLYKGLKMRSLSIDERLDVLLHVKWTVKEFDCNLTREIVDLIDREADMLNRGRPEKSLDGLRARLLNLFLQFIETPEFNPEAIRHQKVPREMILSNK